MAIGEIIYFFFSDVLIMLPVNGQTWSQSISAFSLDDRLALLGLMSPGKILWLFILYQFWILCRLYRQNKIFTVQNARCFAKIGWILMVLCIFEMGIIHLVGGYLYYRDITPSMTDITDPFVFNFDFFVAGLFFWLIAKIMEHAAMMRAEADLTI